MKKLISMLMALTLVCSLVTVSAMAESTSGYSGESNKITGDTAGNTSQAGVEASTTEDTVGTGDVAVKVQTNLADRINVYAVAYDTTELTFTYSPTDVIWNPDTLEYEIQDGGNWDEGSQTVKVTNYSDLAVTVSAEFNAQTGNDVQFAVSNGFTLDTAYNSTNPESSAATSDTFTVSVDSGTPAAEHLTATDYTTMTITISKASD